MVNLNFLKPIIYFIIYLLAIQLFMPYFIPTDVIYNNRMNYDFVKNRTTNIETVLEQVKITIEKEHLNDYLIILGDSVAYSNPGPADQSITYYLNDLYEKEGEIVRVFNLALPAMQTGDIYTMLLKMKQYGISSDHIIINVIYAGFVRRTPDPPAVYWLQQQLKSSDMEAYNKVAGNLAANAGTDNGETTAGILERVKSNGSLFLYENINMFKYKDLWQIYFSEKSRQIRNVLSAETQPILPWYTKDFLPALLKQPEYQRDYSDEAFEMDEDNPQIYFLDKIIELQSGKNTLIFLTAINDGLLGDDIGKAGYQANLKRIDDYFKGKPVDYLNLYGSIDNGLFSDHVHLTSEGYYYLSALLFAKINTWK